MPPLIGSDVRSSIAKIEEVKPLIGTNVNLLIRSFRCSISEKSFESIEVLFVKDCRFLLFFSIEETI